nr:MAG TPA: hypothetical protein [Caudoviricetes sp.]
MNTPGFRLHQVYKCCILELLTKTREGVHNVHEIRDYQYYHCYLFHRILRYRCGGFSW